MSDTPSICDKYSAFIAAFVNSMKQAAESTCSPKIPMTSARGDGEEEYRVDKRAAK